VVNIPSCNRLTSRYQLERPYLSFTFNHRERIDGLAPVEHKKFYVSNPTFRQGRTGNGKSKALIDQQRKEV